MMCQYPYKTTFNKLPVGAFFTFRKPSKVSCSNIESDCYKVNDEIITEYGIKKINVRDLSGGARYIKNKRAVVWTDYKEEKEND